MPGLWRSKGGSILIDLLNVQENPGFHFQNAPCSCLQLHVCATMNLRVCGRPLVQVHA